jgi:glycosyltransferase involved in cell wall biosynthesis
MTVKNNEMRLPLEVSLVIPTWNRVEALTSCLKSVFMQKSTISFEVIVVLDARDNQSEAYIVQNWPQALVVRSKNPGSNAARNQGVQAARGRIVAFLDDDCVLLREDWIIMIADCFKEYPAADAIGGPYFSTEDASLFVRCRNEMSNAYVMDSMVSAVESMVLLGGNSAYRKESFVRWGGFDEFLCYGACETELNARIVAGGGRLCFFQELSVVHVMTPRSLYRHCCQAFLQGRGFAYICCRHKRRVYAGSGFRMTMSSLSGVVGEREFLWEKTGAMIFIMCNVLFYQMGCWWGRIKIFMTSSLLRYNKLHWRDNNAA